jgi:hypothetical protein
MSAERATCVCSPITVNDNGDISLGTRKPRGNTIMQTSHTRTRGPGGALHAPTNLQCGPSCSNALNGICLSNTLADQRLRTLCMWTSFALHHINSTATHRQQLCECARDRQLCCIHRCALNVNIVFLSLRTIQANLTTRSNRKYL